MRVLREANSRASDAVPVLPRGRPAGAIVAPDGTQWTRTYAPRAALHASGGSCLLLCRWIRRAAVASGSDPAPGRKVPSAAAVPGWSGPDSLRVFLAHQIVKPYPFIPCLLVAVCSPVRTASVTDWGSTGLLMRIPCKTLWPTEVEVRSGSL